MVVVEKISKSNKLNGIRVIITGCGYKELKHTFFDIVSQKPSHDSIIVNGNEMKLNIGAATALVLALNGATVHMVSTSEEKLKNLKNSFDKIIGNSDLIEFSVLDLLNEESVKNFVESFPKDKTIYWVQSVGLGAGSYKLKDDNPYLPLEEIPIDLIENESKLVLRSTHLLMKELLPVFKKQKETRIAIISSMSAIRGYSVGGTHCAAKGAIDRYANSAMIGLYKKNIFVSTIRPGAIDTGLYDNEAVQDAIKTISDDYSGIWRKQITLGPPTQVGESVLLALTVDVHIPSINLVAKGQFPNEGS